MYRSKTPGGDSGGEGGGGKYGGEGGGYGVGDGGREGGESGGGDGGAGINGGNGGAEAKFHAYKFDRGSSYGFVCGKNMLSILVTLLTFHTLIS